MAAGDGEEMIQAGLLEVLDGRLVQPAVLAEEEGLEHGPLVGDILPVRGREAALELALDAPADARHPGQDRPGRGGPVADDEAGAFRRGPAVDADRLEMPFVGKGSEVAEGPARAEPDRGPDMIARQIIEAGARSPDERHAEPQTAADRLLHPSRRDGPDVEEEDVPVGLPSRRPGQAPGDVDVSLRAAAVERVGLIIPVEDGEAGGAQRRDRGQGGKRGRAVGSKDEESPGCADREECQDEGRAGGEGEGLGGSDARAKRGGQEDERRGAGP